MGIVSILFEFNIRLRNDGVVIFFNTMFAWLYIGRIPMILEGMYNRGLSRDFKVILIQVSYDNVVILLNVDLLL